ncbi:LOW QUALITY PROTEIN: olfactory receptor 2W3-like [Tachyglossus aculeatus]|uniref:LOW QUALITY PROTEIN: olfactory receptor 2W3-like n=1 Tax=Tachyglossus aculeatus TaxID=9261 RepID=UPI0018F59A87|nr:LOW QUALITY PROTEIN: olfactory receptor 2W3-like [Tachyglossus aculeatus]
MASPNGSERGHFVLLGFSDRPRLEPVLFGVILAAYVLTLVGNSAIILVAWADRRLHTPMYFFLANLSFLDLCFTTTSIPQLLFNLRGPDKTISYWGCAVQLFLFLGLGGAECFLLAAMAYDRLVAVCRPLRYPAVVRPRLCLGLVSGAWAGGLANSSAMSPVTLSLPRCGRREVDHFLCEMPALIRAACVDTAAVEGTVFVLAVAVVLAPLVFILVSYAAIVLTVMGSKAGRRKAANTCGAHLTVVFLFYGNIVYIYMRPGGGTRERNKFPTLFYNVVTPLFNPLIYTLRNREVKGALRNLLLGPGQEEGLIRAWERPNNKNDTWEGPEGRGLVGPGGPEDHREAGRGSPPGS